MDSAALPPADAVTLLGHLIRKADRRSNPEAAAMEGLLRAVRDLLDDAVVDAIFNAAEDDLEVQALFARTQAARDFDHDREEWIDREMRARTLGERRFMARTHDRDLLARLAADTPTLVVKPVLQNARCHRPAGLPAP